MHTQGTIRQLGRDGAGIIVEDAPQRNVYGLAKEMLQPDLSPEQFVQLEGRRVRFDVVDETAINLELIAAAASAGQ